MSSVQKIRPLNLLSIVIPCHNEEEVLPSTHQRLSSILRAVVRDGGCRHYEIVYVDDDSTDRTQEVLLGLFNQDAHVRIIALRRNFGHQGALSAGLFYARGEAVVSLDADLQDPPEKIPEMVASYHRGFDLVLGVRADRSSDTFFKRFFAEKYYSLLKVLGVKVVYNHGDFRLMARPLVDEFNALEERNRLMRAMILKLDNRYAVVSYAREPRTKGKTKYNCRRMFSLSLDGILSFSYAPLRWVSFLGIALCLLAIGMAAWVIYVRMTSSLVPGWASIMTPIFFFSGMQFLVLGVIGEYIGRLYIEVKRRPLFSVRKEYNH